METRKKEEKSTSQSSETIWSKVKIKLQQVYGEEEYSNWIKLLTLHSIKKNKINFNAPTKFMCDWIYSHYGKKILSLWRENDKSVIDLSIIVYEKSVDPKIINEDLKENKPTLENKSTSNNLYNNLDPRFTLKILL